MLIDHEIALLAATSVAHAEALPPAAASAISAATDELIDPLGPPTLVAIDGAATTDLEGVLGGVRNRLLLALDASPDVHTAMRLARAARELNVAIAALLEAA